jgi:hypothetical protein
MRPAQAEITKAEAALEAELADPQVAAIGAEMQEAMSSPQALRRFRRKAAREAAERAALESLARQWAG